MRKTFQTIATLSVGIVAMIAGGQRGLEETASAQAGAAATQIPKFRAEGSWPKVPSKWIMAIVSSTWIDEQDHLWVLQRPNTLSAEEKRKAAPPVLEFDAEGNFIQAWGGPGAGYDWMKLPRSEEHTSELQSLAYLVCRLLLEKKKTDRKCAMPRCSTCG